MLLSLHFCSHVGYFWDVLYQPSSHQPEDGVIRFGQALATGDLDGTEARNAERRGSERREGGMREGGGERRESDRTELVFFSDR